MKSNYKEIGELIEKVDERNVDGSISTLVGVSIEKCFIKSVANTIGTDLTKYKVIRRNEFAVSLMQVSRDEKIPVARLADYDSAIMSPAYPIFKVKDANVILPEYLDMWFKRSEFDREASFIAVGGVRGSMPYEEFCRMKVLVPPIEKQRNIVKAYKTITDRIALKQRINDNLDEQLIAHFMLLIGQVDETEQLNNICRLVSEKATFGGLDNQIYVSTENILPNKQGINYFGTTDKNDRITPFQTGDVLIANIRPYFKKIWQCNQSGACNADVLCFRANDNKYKYVLKALLYQDTFYDYVMSGAKGTKMPRGDKEHIMKYTIPCISDVIINKINIFAKKIEDIQLKNLSEIMLLSDMQNNLLSQLSSY